MKIPILHDSMDQMLLHCSPNDIYLRGITVIIPDEKLSDVDVETGISFSDLLWEQVQ